MAIKRCKYNSYIYMESSKVFSDTKINFCKIMFDGKGVRNKCN